EKIVELGVKYIEIKEGTTVGVENKRVVEERYTNLVTGCEHDDIGFHLAPVAEADLIAGELGKLGLYADAPMARELRQHRVHRGMSVPDPMLGPGQSVTFVLAHHEPMPVGVKSITEARRHW